MVKIYSLINGDDCNHELTEPINLIGMIHSKEERPQEQIIIILNRNKNVYLLGQISKIFPRYY